MSTNFSLPTANLSFSSDSLGERFHHADAGQAVLDLRVELAEMEARFLEAPAHPAREVVGAEHHQRQRRKHDDRQHHVRLAENCERRHDLDQGDEHLFREVVREFGDVVEVGGDARHQLTDLGVVVITVRKVLQVREQIAAHFRFNVCAHNVPDGLHIIVCGGVDDAQHQIYRAELEHRRDQQRHAIRRRAGDIAHDQRQDKVANRRQRGAEQVQRHDAHVRAEIGKKGSKERDRLAKAVFPASFLHR